MHNPGPSVAGAGGATVRLSAQHSVYKARGAATGSNTCAVGTSYHTMPYHTIPYHEICCRGHNRMRPVFGTSYHTIQASLHRSTLSVRTRSFLCSISGLISLNAPMRDLAAIMTTAQQRSKASIQCKPRPRVSKREHTRPTAKIHT